MKLYDTLKELECLKTDDESEVARKRGFDFEKLIRDLFLYHNLLSVVKTTGYHTGDNRSEQIDGVINLDGKIFLLEAKWDKHLAASALYEFIGKIENKFFGTLGVFVSYLPLSENFINALRKGRKQNVIVIHGNDVQLLFGEEINLKLFLQYALERLSFDNSSYISVKEFISFSKKTNIKEKIETNDEKVKEFFKNNIICKEQISSLDMEVELEGLTLDEKAKIYLILFNRSKEFLTYKFPVRPSYLNTKTFFAISKPDFTNHLLKDLPDNYFGESIFLEPKIYLSNFLSDFIDTFQNLSTSGVNAFNKKICDLLKATNYDEENALTLIIEKYSNRLPRAVSNCIHKVYINFYYSSRELRFPQKAYAKRLIRERLIDKSVILEWINEKIKDELKFYANSEELNLPYFAKTYIDLGSSLNLSQEQWMKELRKIFKKLSQ
jgi:hypothetical protein